MFKIFFKQLILSITSSDFYYDVYKHYNGYGLRYLFTVIFFSMVLYSSVLLNNMINLKNYFLKDQINSSAILIENIFKQLPIIDYDGKNISIEEDLPFYLTDSTNNKIGVIDTNSSLSYKELIKIPIVLSKNKIIFYLSNHQYFALDYFKIFGNEKKILTSAIIKQELGKMIKLIQKIFIYLGFPLLIILNLLTNIFENVFIIGIIYFITRTINVDITLKACIRLAFFNIGSIIILHFIIIIIYPPLNKYLWVASLWPKYLLFNGIIKASNLNNFNFRIK